MEGYGGNKYNHAYCDLKVTFKTKQKTIFVILGYPRTRNLTFKQRKRIKIAIKKK